MKCNYSVCDQFFNCNKVTSDEYNNSKILDKPIKIGDHVNVLFEKNNQSSKEDI